MPEVLAHGGDDPYAPGTHEPGNNLNKFSATIRGKSFTRKKFLELVNDEDELGRLKIEHAGAFTRNRRDLVKDNGYRVGRHGAIGPQMDSELCYRLAGAHELWQPYVRRPF